MNLLLNRFIVLVFSVLLFSCSEKVNSVSEKKVKQTLFTKLPSEQTGIIFQNRVTDTKDFNYLFYQYMYNGGGVAAGDINNDGLVDLYFTGNQVSNKLYLNKGGLAFEDITSASGIAEFENWSTGVSIVDINADGWLDYYVCNSASLNNDTIRANKLFINNKNNTFTDKAAEWGVADIAYSNQAYFFDFDKDGDLDLYLLNHRIDFKNNFDTNDEVEKNYSPLHSDKLYRNEGEKFTDVTVESGILNHAWGLSCSIGDFNNDGWEDIYVCNDFVQPDYLYINQKDGTFRNEINERMSHISFYSMGSDFQDINNDGHLDLLVADMVSQDHERSIRNMAAMDTEEFQRMEEIGYHKQYMFNMLQLNQGNGEFAEIGQMAGLSKTDWSWAPLIVDLDNDGFKDVFITNGIKKDVTDIDYKEEVRMRAVKNNRMGFEEVFNSWPSTRLKNYAFENNKDLTFTDVSKEWGLAQAQNSNGTTYADLDNDGDLELVINNIDEPAAIYQNNSKASFVKIKLNGKGKNVNGIGAIVTTENSISKNKQTQTIYPSRGYCSSSSDYLIFACDSGQIHLTTIIWPDGNKQVYKGPGKGAVLEIDYFKTNYPVNRINPGKYFEAFNSKDLGLDFKHQENEFNDFEREILLPQKQSTLGGCQVVSDFNGDGLDDVFFGNAKDASPLLYVQNSDGKFRISNSQFWYSQRHFEDQTAIVFDFDKDGDNDLLVGSGGNEMQENEELLSDRLYINDGKGKFERDENALQYFSNTTCYALNAIENEDRYLFVGAKMIPGLYPNPSPSYLYKIENGKFHDVTKELAKGIESLGMVTDAVFFDFDGDKDDDLVVVGEWMPITIFKFQDGKFVEPKPLLNSKGWWNCISSADIDTDGDLDIIVGNLGENNKFKPTREKPFHLYANDFDDNGTLDLVLSKEYKDKLLPARGRECSSNQMPFIKDKYPTFTQFGKAELRDIYGQEKLNESIHLQVETFSTVYLENDNGKLRMHRLPSSAQMGPTLDVEISDINNDGFPDIIGTGNMYDTEAETISYDANRGYILLGNGQGKFVQIVNSGFYSNSNARDISFISVKGNKSLILSNNNGPLKIFKAK